MKKAVRIVLIALALLIILVKGIEWRIESNFESRINRNPERAYDIRYQSLNLHTFFKGVTLNDVSIVPIKIDSGTVVKGTVNYARLNGLKWYDLVFGKRLNINGLIFDQPVFEVTMGTDTVKHASGKGLQELFEDVLSRARLSEFQIQGGSVLLLEPNRQGKRGSLSNLQLSANEIETDSVMWNHLVPFKLGNFEISIDSVSYDLDEFTHLETGRLSYKKSSNELLMSNIDISLTKDWKTVSKQLGRQIDILEMNLQEMRFEGLKASSSIYSELDIVTNKLLIRGLILKDHRDKNMPRPPDLEKPMFKGMVDAIPVGVLVDTIQIENSAISYIELGEGKTEPGVLTFNNIQGTITNVTTLPEQQKKYDFFRANIDAQLGGVAPVELDLWVPYTYEGFTAKAAIGKMDLSELNQITEAMASIHVQSGTSHRIDFEIKAKKSVSQNKLIFDYEDLKVNVIKERKDHSYKDKTLMSALANSAVRNHNLPDKGKYFVAEYTSDRNIYRGPFNFMWTSFSEGFMYIVPGRGIQSILGTHDAKNQNRKKKKQKSRD